VSNDVTLLRHGLILAGLIFVLFGPKHLATGAEVTTATLGTQPYLLQLIRDDAVYEELRLSDAKIARVREAIAEVDPRWWVSRILPAERQSSEISQLTQILLNRLRTILDEDELNRLNQLYCQANGSRMVRLDDVAAALDLTRTQRQSFEKLFDETDAEMLAIQKDLNDKTINAEQANREIATEQRNEQLALFDILTPEQETRLGSLIGKTFDLGKIKRTFPRAPEFQPQGAKWLAGGPVRMESLRGKVVVVFFYAFECINCQRNFPHYLAWHDDMADDVVIIGIQRPETRAEGDAGLVSQAMLKDGFEFPVLFDAQSSNWNAWANTMWPTTYLIDKDGFIRRWWQGEMNWQGIQGEQQMRASIESLIAE